MATTKKPTTTRRAPKATTTTRAKADPGIVEATGRTIKRNPYASAAVATGVVSAIAAAAAGFFAFKKSGKTFSEFSGDLATSVKDKASETSERVKDGVTDAKAKAKDKVAKLRDGLDGEKSQTEIAKEARRLKQTGATTSQIPVDPVIEQQGNVGAVSY